MSLQQMDIHELRNEYEACMAEIQRVRDEASQEWNEADYQDQMRGADPAAQRAEACEEELNRRGWYLEDGAWIRRSGRNPID